MRLRLAAGQCDAHDRGRGSWRGRVSRPGRPGDRSPQQAQGVRAPGRGPRHRGREPRARLQARPPQLRHRGADPARPRALLHPRADQQPDEAGGPRGLWAGDRGARPDRHDAVGREPLLPRPPAGQTRPPAHPLTVAEFQSSPRAPRQVRVAVLVARYHEAVTSRLLAEARPGTRATKRPRRRSPRPTSWPSSAVQRPETKARARAVQLLYAWELSGRPSIATLVSRLAGGFGHMPEGFDRGADLAAKAIAGLPEFDRRVADAAEHWRLDRVGVVEKSILRLALAELAEGATPPRVVIDEAVKLAHWFAGAKAPAFVNGVLDAVARDYGAL